MCGGRRGACSSMVLRLSSIPSRWVPLYAVTASFRSFVHVFHASLTRSNESDSVGSCLRMSSLPTKIDSRYLCHVARVRAQG